MDRLLEVDLSGASRNPRKFSQQTANEFSKLMAQLNVDVEPLLPVFHQWLRSNTLEMPTGATVTTPETDAPESTALVPTGAGTPTTTGGQEETVTAIIRLAGKFGITLDSQVSDPIQLVLQMWDHICEVLQLPPEERKAHRSNLERDLKESTPFEQLQIAQGTLQRLQQEKDKPCPTPDRQITGPPGDGQIIDIDSDTGQITGQPAPDQIGAGRTPLQITDRGTEEEKPTRPTDIDHPGEPDEPDVTPEPGEPEP